MPVNIVSHSFVLLHSYAANINATLSVFDGRLRDALLRFAIFESVDRLRKTQIEASRRSVTLTGHRAAFITSLDCRARSINLSELMTRQRRRH